MFGSIVRTSASCAFWRPTCGRFFRIRGERTPQALIQKSGLESGVVTQAPPSDLFPFREPFVFGDREVSADEVIEACLPLQTGERLQRIATVCQGRSFDIVPVIEGLYDLGNIAAVCRSCDALGYGQMHIVDSSSGKYKQSSRSSKRAEKWLDVRMWREPRDFVASAKQQSRQILVTHFSDDCISISDVDWTLPTAIVFGNERDGVSQAMLDAADQSVIIPMSGFAQSLNVSVAAAITLYAARESRIRQQGFHASLSNDQQKVLTAVMMMRNLKNSSHVLTHILNAPPPEWQQGRFDNDSNHKIRYAAGRPSQMPDGTVNGGEHLVRNNHGKHFIKRPEGPDGAGDWDRASSPHVHRAKPAEQELEERLENDETEVATLTQRSTRANVVGKAEI